jgi:hypothetical protein
MYMKLRSALCRSISWRSSGPLVILTLEGFSVIKSASAKSAHAWNQGSGRSKDWAKQPKPWAAFHTPIPPQIGRKLGKRALEGQAYRGNVGELWRRRAASPHQGRQPTPIFA